MLARRIVATLTLLALPMMVMAVNGNAVAGLADWAYALGIRGTDYMVWMIGTAAACSFIPPPGSLACGVYGLT